jgi:Dolichyl-phosphate-mannose-protein mannosyltransferase
LRACGDDLSRVLTTKLAEIMGRGRPSALLTTKAPRPAEPLRRAGRALRSLIPSNPYDVATCLLLAAVATIALLTFRDYAVSNDEGVQHHYGELIIAYYRSGFADRDLFTYQNLYLYGGLFDVIAVGLARIIPVDPYTLRHILCAITGIGGIAAAAATARLIAGARAGLIAAVALSLCGAWYGAMFNHTKDIPFAAAMMAATFFLVRLSRELPSPRWRDVIAFGLLTGAALGVRSLGLLLLVYLALAIVIHLPWRQHGARLRFAGVAALNTFPAVALAYVIMIAAWPWAAQSPLNPIRGLFAFSEFHYAIRTVFEGRTYEMGAVPRLYVPGYLLIRLPLITLSGVVLAVVSMLALPFAWTARRRDLALLLAAAVLPLACQVVLHGPAFTGMRHFLFVLPALAALAGIGLDAVLDRLAVHGRALAAGAAAAICACFVWDGATLVRLHPYENLSYNALVGGLPGAYRRYDMDYWFNSMPEAIHRLEAYLREKTPLETSQAPKIYSVAVCGIQLSFDRTVTLPQLHWDFRSEWDESEFFIAPTHMNCDRDLDGDIVATVERFGVPIAYVKDRRKILKLPVATAASPPAVVEPNRKQN